MADYVDTQDLIDGVKRIANIPDNQSMISDQQILDFANEEFMTNFLPLVLSKHENYYTIRQDIEITDPTQKRYQIPSRAIGTKIENLAYQTTTDSEDLVEIYRVSFEQITNRSYRGRTGVAFYFENEDIVLSTSESSLSFDTLVMRYNISPNTLVKTDRVSIITAIDRTTGLITVDQVPDNFSVSSKIDFIKSKSPHMILDYDVNLVDLNSGSKFFQVSPSDIPEFLAVGDRICLATESDLIYAPKELHALLFQMVAVRVLESNNDDTTKADRTLQKMEYNTQFLISNRDTNSPIKASVRKNPFARGRRRNRRF